MIIDEARLCHVPRLRELWREAFGDGEEYLDIFFATAFSPKRCRVALIGDELAGALYWLDCSLGGGRVAYLYAIATGKAYRGRGVCTQLMEDTHRHLCDLGYACSVLVPGNDRLFDMYSKFGYKTFCSVSEFLAKPSTRVEKIQRLCKEEYTKLRRDLLPEGSVLQEGEGVELLNSLYELYGGDGFILAARREGDTLYCTELVGDIAHASGTVAALGCREGKFRTAGCDRPFAMYLPLADNLASPTYFGLAFD